MIKNKIYIVFLIISGTILLSRCSFNATSSKSEQTISSEDGLFSITVPAGWRQLTDHELNDQADIQAKNGGLSSGYVVVLTDDKEDFEDYAFEEWKEGVMEPILEDYTIVSEIDAVIDGRPAKQYELQGTIDHVKISMLATYVDGERYFAQILTWAITSKYKSLEEELRTITNSIKGLNQSSFSGDSVNE